MKEVPRGHALNFLIPRKLAIPATRENLKRHEADISIKKEQKAEHDSEVSSTLKSLEGQTVTHTVKANEQGHLFSGINAETIAGILKDSGHMISADAIILEQPIKELGSFPIEISEGELKGSFTLELVGDKE